MKQYRLRRRRRLLLLLEILSLQLSHALLPVPRHTVSEKLGLAAQPEALADFVAQPLSTLVGLGMLAATTATLVAGARAPERILDSKLLDQITKGTFLEKNVGDLYCAYKASRDGWSARDFHANVDNLGSAVVAARISSGITSSVIGGYNPNGWRSTDDYFLSNQAFLWTSTAGNRIVKLPILPGGNSPALFDYATAGPCFGTSDLQFGPSKAPVMGGFAGPDMEDLSLNSGDLRRGKSSIVNFEWTNVWPARGSFRVVELEVYCRKLT